MKIKVEKSEFTNAIGSIIGAVSSKNNIPAVEGILLTTSGDDGVTLTTFDLEKGFRTRIAAKVIEPGSYIINGQRLNQIVRVMPDGELMLSVDNKMTVRISGGKSEFEISAMEGSDFPTLPEFKSDLRFTIKQEILHSMITRTSFAVAQNENRTNLTGAYFVFNEDELKIVACDGNRLAVREQKCEIRSKTERKPEISFILPGKTLTELLKMLKQESDNDITITVTRRNCVFESGELLFFSRVIEGSYLDYNKFIPQNSKHSVVINTEAFYKGLERASLVTEDRTLGQAKSYVKCNFSDGWLMVSSVSVNGKVYDEISIDGMDGELEIGFNCRYLLDALKACGTENVKLEMSTSLTCMVIKPAEKSETEDFVYLVLPIKMRE